MNKKAYTKPAVAVIDVKFESALMQMSNQTRPGFEGQNPDNNSGGDWSDGFETKGEGNFWDEW
ncbi:MAG: hypothetical protein K2O17_09330 [Bacteroidaceae bacterium]|nr:hypothetical protein [Bacteroidaceae bacterium]